MASSSGGECRRRQRPTVSNIPARGTGPRCRTKISATKATTAHLPVFNILWLLAFAALRWSPGGVVLQQHINGLTLEPLSPPSWPPVAPNIIMDTSFTASCMASLMSSSEPTSRKFPSHITRPPDKYYTGPSHRHHHELPADIWSYHHFFCVGQLRKHQRRLQPPLIYAVTLRSGMLISIIVPHISCFSTRYAKVCNIERSACRVWKQFDGATATGH